MIAWLVTRLGVTLSPLSIGLSNGSRLEIDAASDDPPILCESWAHQGELSSAHQRELLSKAFKLVAARRLKGDHHRLILLLGSDDVAQHIQSGDGWHAAALAVEDIEILVAELDQRARDNMPLPH